MWIALSRPTVMPDTAQDFPGPYIWILSWDFPRWDSANSKIVRHIDTGTIHLIANPVNI